MMRLFSILALAVTVGLGAASIDAEAAKRMGSGKSMGTQRQVQPEKVAPVATATPAATNAAATGAAASTKRSWMGPVAGLAAGLGLAALASHLGFGEELASMMMIGLLAVAVMAAVGYFMRRRAAKQTSAGGGAFDRGVHPYGMQPVPVSGGPTKGRTSNDLPPPSAAYKVAVPPGYQGGGSLIGTGVASGGKTIGLGAKVWPADFDAERFEANAKANFLRLQAAHDSGNLAEIAQFTTPELFEALKADRAEQGLLRQTTEVVNLQAQVVDVEEQSQGYVVSVRFTGTVRDTATSESESFVEMWHLSKGRDGYSGWLLAGIQQLD